MKLKLIHQSRKLQERMKSRIIKDLISTQQDNADSFIICKSVTILTTVGKHKNTCSAAYNLQSPFTQCTAQTFHN